MSNILSSDFLLDLLSKLPDADLPPDVSIQADAGPIDPREQARSTRFKDLVLLLRFVSRIEHDLTDKINVRDVSVIIPLN